MKRNRIIWFVTWIISIIIISFFGGAVSYTFFYCITLIPLISLIYLLYVYFFFHIYQKVNSRNIVVDQPVPYYFILVNEYPFSFAGVRVRFYSSFSYIRELNDDIEYELLPKTEIKKETNIVCKYRGQYDIGIKTVEIQDFFRLFKFSYHNSEVLNVSVYPKLVYLDSLGDIDISHVMNESQFHKTEPDVLTREYIAGDDIRQIHWANSAKSHTLMTREFTGEEQQGVGIVLDTMRFSSDSAIFLPVENKMLEVLLAISLFLSGKNILTREYHLDSALSANCVQDRRQFESFYNTISKIEFNSIKTLSRTFESLSGCYNLLNCHTVFLIIHEWSECCLSMISSLIENESYVVVYIIGDASRAANIAHSFSRVKIITIDPKQDIREVIK